MRAWVPIAVASLTALSTGALYWRDAVPPPPPTAASALTALRKALVEVPILSVVDVGRTYPGRLGLLHPDGALPTSHHHPLPAIAAVYRYAQSCSGEAPGSAGTGAANATGTLAKAWTWHRYACGALDALPSDFFTRRPWIHPSGRSYAALAVARGSPAEALVPFALADEVAGWAVPLGASLALFTGLDPGPRRALAEGRAFAVSAGLLFVRDDTADRGPRSLAYRTYERLAVRAPGLIVQTEPAAGCVAIVGNGCLAQHDPHTARRGWLAASTLLAIIAFTVFGVAARIRDERRARADRLFVMRSLTHELRTPVTGLRMAVDTMRDEFDNLSEDGQAAFGRMCDDTARINRVIAGSSRYLRAWGDGDSGRYRSEPVAIDELLDAVADGDERVSVSAASLSVDSDAYWLTACVRNLVDNALHHGVEPVSVSAEDAGQWITIQVADGGRLAARHLDELIASSEPGRGGLGLGLRIVDKVVQDLGGRLTFTPDPTTFIIHLRRTR